MTKMSWQKLTYLENEKSLKSMKQKAFFITFKGLSIKQIEQKFFGRWESDFTQIFWKKLLSALLE